MIMKFVRVLSFKNVATVFFSFFYTVEVLNTSKAAAGNLS